MSVLKQIWASLQRWAFYLSSTTTVLQVQTRMWLNVVKSLYNCPCVLQLFNLVFSWNSIYFSKIEVNPVLSNTFASTMLLYIQDSITVISQHNNHEEALWLQGVHGNTHHLKIQISAVTSSSYFLFFSVISSSLITPPCPFCHTSLYNFAISLESVAPPGYACACCLCHSIVSVMSWGPRSPRIPFTVSLHCCRSPTSLRSIAAWKLFLRL